MQGGRSVCVVTAVLPLFLSGGLSVIGVTETHRYPVAVLQEAGHVAVCGLEAGQVRVAFLLQQQRTLRFVPGICV